MLNGRCPSPYRARGNTMFAWSVLVWTGCLLSYTGRGVLPDGLAGVIAPVCVCMAFAFLVVFPVVTGSWHFLVAERRAQFLVLLAIAWAIPLIVHAWDNHGATAEEMWIRVAVKSGAGFLAASCVIVLRAEGLRGAGWSISLMACLAAGVLVLNSSVFWIETPEDVASRTEAGLASSVSLGLLFMIGFGVGAGLMNSRPALGGALIVLTTAGNAICLQRFGIVLGPIIMLIFAGWKFGLLWLSVLIAVALASGQVLEGAPVLGPLIDYFLGLADGSGITIRGEMLELALGAFAENWGFGIGVGRWPQGQYPHSFVAQAFSDLGVFGGVTALGLALSVLYATLCCVLQGAQWPARDRVFVAAACCGWLFCVKAGDLQAADVLIPLAAGAWGVGRSTSAPPAATPAARWPTLRGSARHTRTTRGQPQQLQR